MARGLMKKIKVIFCDLDGVIRHFPSERDQEIESKYNLEPGSLYNVAFEKEVLDKVVTGKISDEKWRTQIFEKLSPDNPQAQSAVNEWADFPGQIDQNVLRLLDEIGKIAPVAMITNGTSRLSYDLKKLGIDKRFAHIFNSSDLGVEKPKRQIFDIALKHFNLEPEEAFFIDDSSKHTDAANSLGITTHTYTNYEELLKICEELGLLRPHPKKTPPQYTLRNATNDDFSFLKKLHRLTMKKHVEIIWGWDDEQQSSLFQERFNPSEIKIIEHEGAPCGMVTALETDNEIFLGNILLILEKQNLGIGTHIISDLMDKAKKKQIPLTLTVLRPNRAKYYYERLGFKVIKEDEIRFYMQWDSTIINSHSDTLLMLDNLFKDEEKRWDHFFDNLSDEHPLASKFPDESLVSSEEICKMKPGLALDIGCGNGRNSIFFAEKGFKVDAIDLSKAAISLAKKLAKDKNCNINFFTDSLFNFESNGQYDVIYDAGLFHHIFPHRRPEYLQKIFQFLKDDGVFCLVAFNEKMGSIKTDLEIYQNKSMEGGISYPREKLISVFNPMFELLTYRPLKNRSKEEQMFGHDFVSASTWKKQPDTNF